MLAKLKIKNFVSFKNETVIDFKKTNYTILPQNVCEKTGILKGAMIAGGNGAGKSTIIEALKIFLDLMFKESDIYFANKICFATNNPEFYLEYMYEIQNCNIRYRLKYNRRNDMISEYLYLDEKKVFVREGMYAVSYFNDTELVYDADLLKRNGIFLRTLYFNGSLQYSDVLKEWMDFLKNSRYINASTDPLLFLDSQKLHIYFNEHGTDDVNNFLTRYHYEQRIQYTTNIENPYQTIESNDKILFYKRIGNDFSVPAEMESLGNRNLVRILIDYLWVLKKGGMLLLDEFSSGFHNELEKILVQHFMKESNNSQMIFVSHSTNLMSNSILRPDQVYLVSYLTGEGSAINRISSFQPRNSQNIEKMYNNGSFSGRPIYEDINDEI